MYTNTNFIKNKKNNESICKLIDPYGKRKEVIKFKEERNYSLSALDNRLKNEKHYEFNHMRDHYGET